MSHHSDAVPLSNIPDSDMRICCRILFKEKVSPVWQADPTASLMRQVSLLKAFLVFLPPKKISLIR